MKRVTVSQLSYQPLLGDRSSSTVARQYQQEQVELMSTGSVSLGKTGEFSQVDIKSTR